VQAVAAPTAPQVETTSQFRPLVERWAVEISAPPVGAPVVSGDVVAVALQPSGVVAYRGLDGALLWKTSHAADRPLVVDEERIYVVARDSICALGISKGEELWQQKTGALSAPLLVQSGWVIAISPGNIAAYRGTDGAVLWSRSIGAVQERPAIDGDVLFVPLLEGAISALNLQTGKPLWSQSVGAEPGEPLAVGGKVYVGARDKMFHTLDAATGEPESPIRVGAGPRGRPAADDDHIYVVFLDNFIRTYDRGHGALQWQEGLKYRPSGGPVLLSDALIVPGAVTAMPVFRRENGDQLAEVTFPATLVGMSNVLYGPWNYPMFAAVTGDLQHPWRLSFLEPSTEPPPIPIVPLTELPGTMIPIALPQ
jgi:outer membrane protein assembly factor BamB